MTEPPVDRAATAFADALAHLREERGLSKKQLAAEETRWHAVTSAVNRVLRMA